MEINRKSGIDCISDVPWGTHFCNVYINLNDMADVMMPYFEAGFTNNEICVWVIPKSFSPEEARGMLSKYIPNIEQYIDKKQIEILSYDQVYIIDGVFNGHRAIRTWFNKLDHALARGFDGLRVAGSTDWVEIKDWKQFVDYERQVNNSIDGHSMIAICNYSLLDCNPSQIADAILTHQFCVINKEGEKRIIADSNSSSVVAVLKKKNQELESFNKLCVGREVRIIELKKEIELLKGKV